MLTPEDADRLFRKYQDSLDKLKLVIWEKEKNVEMAARYVEAVNNIKSLLAAIASDTKFAPSLTKTRLKINVSGLDDWVRLIPTNLDMILDLCDSNIELKNTLIAFQAEVVDILKKSAKDASKTAVVEKFTAAEEKNQHQLEVLLYKATEGEFAVKFPDEGTADIFLTAIGGVQHFDKDDAYYLGAPCPKRFQGSSSVLYFPGYIAGGGEFTGVFFSRKMRENFERLLLVRPSGGNPGTFKPIEHFTRIMVANKVIYFDDRRLLTEQIRQMPEGIFQQMMLDELAKRARTDVKQLQMNKSQTRRLAPLKQKARPPSALRLAITLLIQQPSLAHRVNEPLPHIKLRGYELLQKMIECVKQHPDLTTGGLLEFWRDHEEVRTLAKLAQTEHMIPEEGIQNEFVGAIERLHKLGREQVIEQLIAKANQIALSQEEKMQLDELIRAK